MSLYQKVRPENFGEVVGNTAAISALKNAVTKKDKPHVYLFTGAAGCGKTTLARIMARACDCEDFNIEEVNAASNRGIDDARALMKRAQYSGMGGGNRCVILDECHRLTADAQASLLKTLEDIPGHQYWMLCTTDPQKLSAAIRTRCDKVEVKPLSNDDMEKLVTDACKRGDLPDPPDKVYWAIIDNAEGCPRRALVMLEKVNGMDEAEAVQVIASFSEESPESIKLCFAMEGGKLAEAIKLFAEITKGRAPSDAEAMRNMIAGYLRSRLQKTREQKFADALRIMVQPVMYTYMPGLLSLVYDATKAMGGNSSAGTSRRRA